jgi:hypothetical protein
MLYPFCGCARDHLHSVGERLCAVLLAFAIRVPNGAILVVIVAVHICCHPAADHSVDVFVVEFVMLRRLMPYTDDH